MQALSQQLKHKLINTSSVSVADPNLQKPILNPNPISNQNSSTTNTNPSSTILNPNPNPNPKPTASSNKQSKKQSVKQEEEEAEEEEVSVSIIEEEEETKQNPLETNHDAVVSNTVGIVSDARPKHIQLEGFLSKRSRYLRSWRKRWIVLIGTTIYTYKCEMKYKDPTETIDVKQINNIEVNTSIKQKPHAFDLHLTKVVFTFAAESKQSQTAWVSEIFKIIALNKACITQVNAAKNNELVSHGCTHLRRNCSLLSECCNNWYFCSYCHDDVEDGLLYGGHQLNRSSIILIRCMQCGKEQMPSNQCTNQQCQIQFAAYYCSICKFWDNNPSHLLFHCKGCNVCRSGDKSQYKHCDKCGVCLDIQYFKTHKCMERVTHCDCPICGDYLHMSDKPVTFWTVCGHAIHVSCMEDYLIYDTLCPICRSPWLPS